MATLLQTVIKRVRPRQTHQLQTALPDRYWRPLLAYTPHPPRRVSHAKLASSLTPIHQSGLYAISAILLGSAAFVVVSAADLGSTGQSWERWVRLIVGLGAAVFGMVLLLIPRMRVAYWHTILSSAEQAIFTVHDVQFPREVRIGDQTYRLLIVRGYRHARHQSSAAEVVLLEPTSTMRTTTRGDAFVELLHPSTTDTWVILGQATPRTRKAFERAITRGGNTGAPRLNAVEAARPRRMSLLRRRTAKRDALRPGDQE
jgi:hypothetical protein